MSASETISLLATKIKGIGISRSSEKLHAIGNSLYGLSEPEADELLDLLWEWAERQL